MLFLIKRRIRIINNTAIGHFWIINFVQISIIRASIIWIRIFLIIYSYFCIVKIIGIIISTNRISGVVRISNIIIGIIYVFIIRRNIRI